MVQGSSLEKVFGHQKIQKPTLSNIYNIQNPFNMTYVVDEEEQAQSYGLYWVQAFPSY